VKVDSTIVVWNRSLAEWPQKDEPARTDRTRHKTHRRLAAHEALSLEHLTHDRLVSLLTIWQTLTARK
jgi:hypothetical protein